MNLIPRSAGITVGRRRAQCRQAATRAAAIGGQELPPFAGLHRQSQEVFRLSHRLLREQQTVTVFVAAVRPMRRLWRRRHARQQIPVMLSGPMVAVALTPSPGRWPVGRLEGLRHAGGARLPAATAARPRRSVLAAQTCARRLLPQERRRPARFPSLAGLNVHSLRCNSNALSLTSRGTPRSRYGLSAPRPRHVSSRLCRCLSWVVARAGSRHPSLSWLLPRCTCTKACEGR